MSVLVAELVGGEFFRQTLISHFPSTDLIFVGGVKWDLSHFLVPFSHLFDRSAGELDALQQGRF